MPINVHNNEFVMLNGIPYIVGEYVDKGLLQTLDSSVVSDQVSIDSVSPLRTIIDISVNDIQRNNDQSLNVIGNKTRLSNMIDIIRVDWNNSRGRLKVLRKGIFCRVYYQIENGRTGLLIRSMQEVFYIDDKHFFISINPNDINDNGLVTNFSDMQVTSVNQFTSRRDPMLIRVTGVELFYECTESDPMKPRAPVYYNTDRQYPPYEPTNEEYYYHKKMQSYHDMNDWRLDPNRVPPDTWAMFNRFYHYDENTNSFSLHFDEIYERKCSITPIPCGRIRLNKLFSVNPGTQLIFKISIWKNDTILTGDCSRIADALQIPKPSAVYFNPYIDHYIDPHYHPPVPPPDRTDILHTPVIDYAQNKVINQLTQVVMQLQEKVNSLTSNQNTNNDDNSEDENNSDDNGDAP